MLSPQQGNKTSYEAGSKKLGFLIMLQAPVTNNETTMKLLVTHITKSCLTLGILTS